MKKMSFRRRRPLFVSPVPKSVSKPKIKWKVLPILWLAFKRMCFFLGLSMFLSAFVGVYVAGTLVEQKAPAKLPQEMVLYLPIEGGFLETPREATFSEPFAGGQPTVHDVVYAINKAAEDDRVKGLLARLDNGALSLTHIQEIRTALENFKAAGKFTKIYASSYGGAGGGLGRYYLASAFDEIWMQPLGVVTIAGIKAEVPFLKGLLDKFGVTPNFFQRKEYKTAYESLTNTEMSKENRESLQQIVDGIRGEIMGRVPAERGMSADEFQSLIDQGLFTAEEAIDAKLITHRDYADVLVERIRKDIKGDAQSEAPLFVGIGSYLGDLYNHRSQKLMAGFRDKKPRVALIYTIGAIMDSDVNAMSPVFIGGGVAASDKIAQAIIDAADDPRVETIVLRVDSPGGSPIASERILRALQNAQNKDDKTVIVSMGATAASGGYWVSASADQIFAMPTTITGSIGVVGGKFAIGETFDKIGVNWDDSVQWGKNAGMWSLNTPFSASEAERVNAMLDQIYDAFLERVAAGRGMSVEEVDKIAGGRIWTGQEAVEVGLVDQIGGLDTALNYAATLSGKQSRDEIEIVILPKPKTTFEQILGLLGQQGVLIDGFKIQADLLSRVAPVLQDLEIMGRADGPMVYEPFTLEAH